MLRHTLGPLAAFALVIACGGTTSSSSANAGSETGACLSDGTCNAGLTCASNTCVNLNSSPSEGGIQDSGDTTSAGGSGTGQGGNPAADSGGTGGASTPSPCSAADQAGACGARICGRDPVCNILCGTCLDDQACRDGAECINIMTDNENCGAIGVPCADRCFGGECLPTEATICEEHTLEYRSCDLVCAGQGAVCTDTLECRPRMTQGACPTETSRTTSCGYDPLPSDPADFLSCCCEWE